MADQFIEKSFDFTSQGLTLQGTITLPRNHEKPPVFLLLPGSGPVDRNENATGFFRKLITNNFQTIAHYLAAQGFASYRFDKRSTHKSMKSCGFNILLEDAKNALKALQQFDGINRDELYLLGHSEGGYIGTLIANKQKNVKGFIVIASSVTPLDETVVKQISHISEVKGSSKKMDKLSKILSQVFSLMRTHDSWEEIDPSIIKSEMKKLSFIIQILPANTVKNMMKKQFQPHWFMESFQYDFEQEAKHITCPVLLIAGEKDYQVPVEDVEYMANVISSLGNEDVTFVEMSDLNHLLRPNPGEKSPKAQLQSLKESDIDQRVLDLIGNWLHDHYF